MLDLNEADDKEEGPDTFDKETCPNCGEPVERAVSARREPQYPELGLTGTWVEYRCSCGFARDYME